MKVVLIDDEPLARHTLRSLIENKYPVFNIVGEADSVQSSVNLIVAKKPDLVFLDVDLTDGNGFDVLNSLPEINFKIIFITAHQEYALKAIKFSAFDYILKPISSVELSSAIERVVKEEEKNADKLKIDAFFNNINTDDQKSKKIVLKTSESIHLVEIAEIIRCEADNNYTTFYVEKGAKIIISKGLKEYEDLLTEYGFFRVHQSHLINVKNILRFDKKDGGYVILSDASQIPVSQRKKQKLLEIFNNLGKQL